MHCHYIRFSLYLPPSIEDAVSLEELSTKETSDESAMLSAHNLATQRALKRTHLTMRIELLIGEVIKPGLDSGMEWNLESLHMRTRSIITMLRRLLFRRVLSSSQ